MEVAARQAAPKIGPSSAPNPGDWDGTEAPAGRLIDRPRGIAAAPSPEMMLRRERDSKEREPDREQRKVLGITVGGIAADHLDDVGGHRFDRVSGFKVIWGRMPAASTTAIVSPTARLIARMNEANTPERRRGQHDPGRHLKLGRSQTEGCLAQPARNRRKYVFTKRRHQRNDHHPYHDAGRKRIERLDSPAQRLEQAA